MVRCISLSQRNAEPAATYRRPGDQTIVNYVFLLGVARSIFWRGASVVCQRHAEPPAILSHAAGYQFVTLTLLPACIAPSFLIKAKPIKAVCVTTTVFCSCF